MSRVRLTSALLRVACMAIQVREVALLSTGILGWWTRGMDLTWGLTQLVRSSSSSASCPPQWPPASCPGRVDVGRPPAALPRGTWREVVRGEFALVNDAQYTVDLFSVSHCTGHLLRADGDSREDALLWVPRQYTSTCSWPWNYQTGAASIPIIQSVHGWPCDLGLRPKWLGQ